MKCSFLDYIQLLMIGRAIRAKNIDQNTKKQKRPPKTSKNKMFIFGLHSTPDDWPSNPSKKYQPKHKKTKRPPKLSKNKMFIFGLCSTSDDWLSDPSKKLSTEIQKNEKGPLSHWKMKCSFLDYVQLLMIGWAIWAKNVDQNTKKKQKMPPKISKNKMFIFGLQLTPDDRPSNLSKKHRPKHNKQKRPPKTSKNKMFIFFITFNFWWSAERSEQKTLTKMQKTEKGPLSHWKIKC